MMMPFVHLRMHSEFSITKSILRINEIVDSCKANNMFAIGLTDHHNLFGMVKFYKHCLSAGLKPIIGVELNFSASNESNYKLILIAKNINGLIRLNELITRSYLENKINDIPYIEESWLLASQSWDKNKDLMVLSGGILGDVGQLICQKKIEEAQKKAQLWNQAFKDDYYLEVQRFTHIDINYLNEATVKLAISLGISVVATHPTYFLKAEDHTAHEVRVCVANGEHLYDENRKSAYSSDLHFLSIEAMNDKFKDLPIALENTLIIAKKCNIDIVLGQYFLPDFAIPLESNLDEFLKQEVLNGLAIRVKEIYNDEKEQEKNRNHYEIRIDLELKTIIQMGFAGYFLIVADFINWAKKNKIPVGPGRGSGAGSLVAFALGITDVEPLRYGLLFERFLNPERVSMPDFDIDFCQDGREKVIEYVKNKYGDQAVAQIATFGTMSSKAVIKDVGRVLGLSYTLCDSISKLILNTPARSYSLLEAYDEFAELKNKIDVDDDEVKRLWDLSLQLEDLTRSVGKHAAGVLIAPDKLTNFCPLYLADGMQTSQFDKDDVEEIGLVKFDFLGLRNLTIIKETLDNISKLYGQTVELSNYDFDDAKVYELLKSGNTKAVFQLDSSGMQRVLVKLAPDCFEDVIALLALYRPGPLGSGMVDDFIRRKNGIDQPDYFHDDLKSCLLPTYGVIVYQEQVMQISQIIGGYTLGGADLLRRAMGKKKPEEMAKHKSIFVAGAIAKGYKEELAIGLFDLMGKFAEYGFNKSHSAGYAVISYHTAYLKTYYLTCFLAATLSSELDKTDKLYEFYQDCVDNDVIVLAPDINTSSYRFLPIDATTISYALGAIKGVGEMVVNLIIEERNSKGHFSSFVDFCSRVTKKVLNKKTLESLVKAGVFDKLDSNRAKLLNNIAYIITALDKKQQNSQQSSLFDNFFDEDPAFLGVDTIELVDYAPWGHKETLQMEKQALGFYFSASLFDEYKDLVKRLGINQLGYYNTENEEVLNLANNRSREKTKVLVCGIVTYIGSRPMKKGGRMYFVKLEDDIAELEFVIFNQEYERFKHLIKPDEMIFVEGDLVYDSFRSQIKVTAKNIYLLDEILKKEFSALRLIFNHNFDFMQLQSILGATGVAVKINYSNDIAKCEVSLGESSKFEINYNNISVLSKHLPKQDWLLT
ncbi:MAG: DNA polymerase III subunit alpha [Bacteroidia bacterium]|nr:MAG: DNA polymerase III subunit alpha [Bacteroidia bacterium]